MSLKKVEKNKQSERKIELIEERKKQSNLLASPKANKLNIIENNYNLTTHLNEKSTKNLDKILQPLKKSLEDDSQANKMLLESLRKKQINEAFSLQKISKEVGMLDKLNDFFKENMQNVSQLFTSSKNMASFLPQPSMNVAKEQQNSIGLMKPNNDSSSILFEKNYPSFYNISKPNNANIANLEQMLNNLKNKSLEPNLLNMQGNKDSAFTILHFLGTIQSEISSYLYNLAMKSKQNNESKFEKIHNFFMNLGNSNTFGPLIFPNLHVNNNSNIFSNFFEHNI